MRDITLEETIYLNFTTRSFSTGVPTALAGSPALSVLESNNATPITSGVSVQTDRASVTGLNQATIVATAASGYEAGKSYSVYISTGTVGGVSVVGEVVGQFTMQAGAAFTRLGAPAGASTAADIAAVNAKTTNLPASPASTTNITAGTITTVTNLTNLPAIPSDWLTAAGTAADFGTEIGTAVWASAARTLTASTNFNDISTANVLAQVNAAIDTAISELGVAAPTATPTLRTGLMLLYMALRNKLVVQTSGTDALEIYNDAGTKITSKLLTDTGGDYTEAKAT